MPVLEWIQESEPFGELIWRCLLPEYLQTVRQESKEDELQVSRSPFSGRLQLASEDGAPVFQAVAGGAACPPAVSLNKELVFLVGCLVSVV